MDVDVALPDAATQHTLAANPLIGIRGEDILQSLSRLCSKVVHNPATAARHSLHLAGEIGRIVAGSSDAAPEPGDRRFADPAWRESTPYRMLAGCYAAWAQALHRLVDDADMSARDAERAHFVVSLVVDAMSPTNSLWGNPAALKRLIDTGGASVVSGLGNFVADAIGSNGLPAQVDTRKFAVGKNLATTAGSVVYRTPVMELIQYRPVREKVHQRPLLIVPPQINKFYVFDLAPEKSLVRYALNGGLQTFAISWKNPTPAESDFGLDVYVGALEEAIEVMREITGCEDVNVLGACSGGITMSAGLAHLAAQGARKVHSATVAVCVLDMAAARDTAAGLFVTADTISAAKAASQLTGVLDGKDLARMFAWMRPNDLIWSYWVNNYLFGNAPPAFDVLYWNSDTTRLPAQLHADFLDLIGGDPLKTPERLGTRGVVLDMRRVDVDSYVVAGVSDHITPWQGCYATAKLYGSRSTFVLSNSGHIQSLLNPPGNPKAFFWAGEAAGDDAQAWRAAATRHDGSWWPHWLEWISARSGPAVDAPVALGSADHRPLTDAPGLYVMER